MTISAMEIIALLLAIILVVPFVIAYYLMKRKDAPFACSKCGCQFDKKVRDKDNFTEEKSLKCPKCKVRNTCARIYER